MPRWSSILKSFRWKVPISADVLFIDARTMCVLLCTHALLAQHTAQQDKGRCHMSSHDEAGRIP